MKNIPIQIDRDKCYELTDRLFLEMSGIDKSGNKFDRMKNDASKMRDMVEDRIDINITCQYYNDL